MSTDPSLASCQPNSPATSSATTPAPTPEQLATCIFSVDGDVSFLEVRQAAAIFGRIDQISLVKDRQFSYWRSMQGRYSARESAFLAHGHRLGGVAITALHPNQVAVAKILDEVEGDFSTEWDKILAAARRLGATEACLEASSTLALPGSRPPLTLPSDAGGGGGQQRNGGQ